MWQITIEQAFSIKSYKWYLLKCFRFLLLPEVSYRTFHEFFRDSLICKYALGSTIRKFILICLSSSMLSAYTLSKSVKTFCLFSQIHSVCISKHSSMYAWLCAYFSILKVPKRKNRFRLSGFIFHFSPSNSAL